MFTRTIGVNELGHRIGENHHRARLADHDVDLLLGLHDEGWSYKRLALKFEISKSQTRNIVKGRQRGQTPTAWRLLPALG